MQAPLRSIRQDGAMNEAAGGQRHPGRTLLILAFAGLAYALAQTTLIPALPDMIRGLHTNESGVTWTLTGYLVSAAVATPLVGRLGDIFGKRRLLVMALVCFAFGMLISALSSDLWVVVAGRVVQGVGGGVFPLCFAIIRDELPRERIGSSVGLMSSVAGIGGGLGFVVGGLLVDYGSYHAIFWVGAAMGAAGAVATHRYVPESPVRTPASLDIRGGLVLAVGLILPLIAIAQANDVGWTSARTLAMIAAGLLVLAYWPALERRTEEPLVDMTIFTSPRVLMTNAATLLVGFGMFGSLMLVSTLAESPKSTGYGFGLSATGAGLLLLPGSLVMLALGPLSGVIGARFGNKVSLGAGGIVTAIGLVLLAVAHGRRSEVLAFSIVMSGGTGLAFAAMPNLILEAVPSRQTGEATGVNALVRAVGSALGSQVSAAVLAGSAVAGVATDAGYRNAFAISAAVVVAAGLVAARIPRAPRVAHASVLAEVGAASPLPDPAYAQEEF